MAERPQVGVGAYVVRGGRLLLGYRLSKHDNNTWSPCGGHLEYGETPAECASRETLEECGLTVSPASWKLVAVTNDVFTDTHKHYITLAYIAEVDENAGEPSLTEPDKWREWQWFDPKHLPNPLMLSVRNNIAAGVDFNNPGHVVTG